MEKQGHTYEYYLHFYIKIIRKENFHHRFSTFFLLSELNI